MKKYKLLQNDVIEVNNTTLYRIKALVYIPECGIKIGDIGGYIHSEKNLSHEGHCWVYGNAQVYGDARVCGDAQISGNASVYGNADISGNASVYGNVQVSGNAWVRGNADISGNAWVCGNADIYGNASVCGDAQVSGNASVCGDAQISGNASVYGNVQISGNASVYGNADISSDDDYAVVSGFGSKNRTTTFFLSSNKKVLVSCGCFIGYLDEFRAKVLETHGGTPLGQEYLMIADLMEARFNRVIESKEEN